MSALNLWAAMELYDLLAPYLTEPEEGELVSSYTHRTLTGMRDAGESIIFFRVMEQLTGLSLEELKALPTEDLLDTFMTGLVENRVIDLKNFVEGLYYAG